MTLFGLVDCILQKRAEASGDSFRIVHDVPGCAGKHVSWSDTGLDGRITVALQTAFPGGLYEHQAMAIADILAGHNVVVTTKTSSGKSLIYTIPIAKALLDMPTASALLFFPTKSLANDQMHNLHTRLNDILGGIGRTIPPRFIARYDGAVPTDERPLIRQQTQVLLTNPDMAHLSVLPWHDKHWQRFISNLRYVVLDEAHEYRGTFGSNMALLLRRFWLLCNRYGATPQIISTSATIASPGDHLRLLSDREFRVLLPEQDTSRQGPKRFYLSKPAAHPYATARALLEALVEEGRSTIVFCLSRRAAEDIAQHFRDDPQGRIRVYKSGLRSSVREEIEGGLRSGQLLGVVATSALELGIDIGLLDVCICVGLPFTMMSLWQRVGRVGRQGRSGAAILIPDARPIDAYYSEHPEDLFERPNEPLAVNLRSRTLAKWHYACALKEAGGEIDRVAPDLVSEPLRTVAREHQEGGLDDFIFHNDTPHHEYNMRAGADSLYQLVVGRAGPNDFEEIGHINKSQMLLECAPNAIHIHDGVRYRVISVRDRPNQIRLHRERSWNRTHAYLSRKVQVLHCCAVRKNAQLQLEKCDRLRVTEFLVNLVEKAADGETVRTWGGSQGRPPNILPTTGVALTLAEPFTLMRDYHNGNAEGVRVAWNGLDPVLTGMLPTVLGPCDLGDFGIHAQWAERDAKLYFYDRAYDGIDLTLPVFDKIELLLREALRRVEECACIAEEGCFQCVRDPFEDYLTNRAGTRQLLQHLVRTIEAAPLLITWESERAALAEEDNAFIRCPACKDKVRIGQRFCQNCGEKLEVA